MTNEFTANTTRRRNFIRTLGATGLVGIGTSLSGCLGGGDGEYPSEEIRALVTAPQGGGSDTYTRQIWNQISDEYDVQVAVENVTAAAGVQAKQQVYSADPDGYHVVIYNSPFGIQNVFQDHGFSMDEFRFPAAFTESVWVLCVDPDLEIENFDDFVERYRNGDLENAAAQNPGQQNHLIWEVMKEDSEYDVPWEQYIAYDGSGPILQAIVSGEVPAGIVTETAAESVVSSGDVDVLVSFGSSGSSVFPDIDSVTDIGYPNIDHVGAFWRGFATTPDVPDDVLEKQAEMIESVVTGEELQSWSEETGNPLGFLSGPEETYNRVEEELQQFEEQIDPDWFMD
ncbi:Bug family tripartite tricarboxylate transporter substrate binding protein [Halobellus salinisoli]|uniref:Bug family tripartite tricarboxylate transporter substrate binding protein n=1 Tax=Halobellus salinisoli TaxID=3108500 RepID=UPI00300ACD30